MHLPSKSNHYGPLTFALLFLLSLHASAFPPAPYHEIYGTVRDSRGHPLSQAATVVLSTGERVIGRTELDATVTPGVNYSLKISMDSGATSEIFEPTAMQPALPFTMRIIIGESVYVPIEIQGDSQAMGEPGKSTRLDLTIGIDSDGDGLPDSWEQDLIDSNPNDNLVTLADVSPGDDSDGDGVSNFAEYIAGTYAFDATDALKLKVLDVENGIARMRFLAITGRTYTIKSSNDIREFSETSFATELGGPERTAIVAQDVRVQYLYVKVGEEPRKFFSLYVQ